MNKEIYPGNDFSFPSKEVTQVSWTIGPVAKLLGIHDASVTTYSEMLELKLAKNPRGVRVWRRGDINRLDLMMKLCRIGLTPRAAAANVGRAEKILAAFA